MDEAVGEQGRHISNKGRGGAVIAWSLCDG